MTKQKTSPAPRVVYVTFAVVVIENTDVDDMVDELDYNFTHHSIIGTQLVGYHAEMEA